MTNTRKITEGAVLLAVFAVLLLVVMYVPILRYLSILVLPLPFIIYTVKYGLKSSLLFLLSSILLSIIVAAIVIPAAFSYGILGLVIGYCIKEKKSRTFLYIASTLSLTITILLVYLVSMVFLNMNVIKNMIYASEATLMETVDMLEKLGQEFPAGFDEMINLAFDLFTALLPTFLIITSFVLIYLILIVCSPILKRFEMALPRRVHFREWHLPQNIIWYFLVIMLTNFFTPVSFDSIFFIAMINLTFMLLLLFGIQGLSFVFYFAYNKGIAKAVPIIVIISIFFLFPIGYLLIILLGIMDIGFDMRQRVKVK